MGKYPSPKVPCPKCGAPVAGTTKVRVSEVTGENNVRDWRVLRRGYACFGCGHKWWHEVAAKAIEEEQ